jgi:hypothetical protein
MTNQNNRGGDNDASSNRPPKSGKRESGGNMGAGRSGDESLGSEKPSSRDNMGSKKPQQ